MNDQRPRSAPPGQVRFALFALLAGVVVGAGLSSFAWHLASRRDLRDRGDASVASTVSNRGTEPWVSASAGTPESGSVPAPPATPGARAGSEPPRVPSRAGATLASALQLAADDFVVDIHQNGRRIPDSDRRLTSEVFGATSERVTVNVKEGDWLVFNVVNNRLRWGGVCYFAVAGLDEAGAITFVSEVGDQWAVCEDPALAPRFISERAFLADQPARSIDNAWTGGDKMMSKQVPGWSGQPIWGSPTNRNIWLKFTAPAP